MNKIMKIKFTLTVLMMSGSLLVHSQDMLENYLIEAARNNPGLKGKFSEYLAALEKITQAGALPDPQVTFGYFIQPVETRVGPQKARISASQMFPWFGTLGAKEDVATEMAKSKYEMFEEAKSRLFYDVKSTWYNLYFTHKAIDVTVENITILNTFRKLALIKVESGLASAADVLRVEMEIADMENQLALLKDSYFVLQASFNNLLNVDEHRVVSIPDSLINTDFDLTREAVLDSIQSGNHNILQIEFSEAFYAKQEIVARKLSKPGFMIGIDYMAIGKSSNSMTNISESGKDAIVFPIVGITIPLYRRKYTSMVRETALMQESTENIKLDKINVLETTFEKANKDYRDADRRITLYTGQSDKASKSLRILQTAYETDGKNFEEVLRMERQLLRYELELEKARADKDAAIAFINYLMGK
jgi:cobalt-zinc-cadmium efflux system outer membrane protein